MRKKLFLPVILLISFSAFAIEVQICRVTSNTDEEISDFYIVEENEQLSSMRIIRSLHGKVISDSVYSVEQIMNGGVVTVRQQGREVVRLKVENFSPETGGIVVQDYLYNGLTNSRGSHRTKLIKQDDEFIYTDLSGRPINRMAYFGRWILGQLVGISSIRTSFDPDGF